MKIKRSRDRVILSILSYGVVGVISLFCIIPFYVLVVSSFSSEYYIINHGFSLFPKELSWDAYELVFLNPGKILHAYSITIFITIVGTLASLFCSSMAAYVMFRKDLKYRNYLAFFLYFTTLFNGGLASYYIIVTSYLHLKNSIFALLLVPMFNVIYILILRNFLTGSMPDELIESAKIDGAGDFNIYARIVLPMFKPALASIGLLTALAFWNDWWSAMMFVEREALWPLQFVLYQILNSVTIAANIVNNVAIIDMPKETLKLAMTVVAIGPVMFIYPFVQRFFVQGITLGSIKG